MRPIAGLAAATLAATLAAGLPPAEAALRIVTTTTDLGYLAREVGGNRVEVDVITRGYQDPHYLEPKPSYIVKLARADAVFYVGLELEVGWLPRLLGGAHNPHIQPGQPGLYSPSDRVAVLERPSSLDRSQGDVHPFGNPHYWLSPPNAIATVRGIAGRLAELDPEGAAGYRQRGDALIARIEQSDAAWRARLAPARGMKVVTYHKTFSYFLEHFGLVALGYIEPVPGVPPSSRHLAELCDKVQAERASLLLIENFFEPRSGELVAARTGVPLVVAPASVEGEKGIDTWFQLMERLVSAVARAQDGGR